MTVKRIVANIKADDVARAKLFYGDYLGLSTLMDQGWIVTYGSECKMSLQLSVATNGGGNTELPDVSIEVDNVDAMYQKAIDHGFEILYPLVTESWGVRRFYVRDPFGKVINILSHA